MAFPFFKMYYYSKNYLIYLLKLLICRDKSLSSSSFMTSSVFLASFFAILLLLSGECLLFKKYFAALFISVKSVSPISNAFCFRSSVQKE